MLKVERGKAIIRGEGPNIAILFLKKKTEDGNYVNIVKKTKIYKEHQGKSQYLTMAHNLFGETRKERK